MLRKHFPTDNVILPHIMEKSIGKLIIKKIKYKLILERKLRQWQN